MITNINNFPEPLKRHKYFNVFMTSNRNDRIKKKPYSPNNPTWGSPTDKRAFADLQTAINSAYNNDFDGIGIMITDNLAGIDLDKVVDDHGNVEPAAVEVVKAINSYTEVSQSGHGLHIFFRVPAGTVYDDKVYYKENSAFIKRPNEDDNAHLEIYLPAMTGRYVAMTGNTYHTTTDGDGLPERNITNLWPILEKYMKIPPEAIKPKKATPATAVTADDYLSDLEVIELLQKNDKQSALWSGDYSGYKSNSEAELALCTVIAWYVADDMARIDDLMKKSGFAENWNSKHEKYRIRTIEKAISMNAGKHYDKSYYADNNGYTDEWAEYRNRHTQEPAPAITPGAGAEDAIKELADSNTIPIVKETSLDYYKQMITDELQLIPDAATPTDDELSLMAQERQAQEKKEREILDRAYRHWLKHGTFSKKQVEYLEINYAYSEEETPEDFFKFYGYDVDVDRETSVKDSTTNEEPKDAKTDTTGLEIATATPPNPKPDNVSLYIDNFMGDDISQFKSVINTGFSTLDKQTGGLYNGLYVIAAISSLGKTTFSHQIADQIATAGHDVLYFSLEQSKLEMVSKSIARTAAKELITNPGDKLVCDNDKSQFVSSLSIRKGYLPQHIKDAAVKYKNDVADRLSIIEGNFTTTIQTIKDAVKAYKDNNGVWPAVFIDYLQIVQPADKKDKRNGAKMVIDDVITELKRLSYFTPVWVICSMNRSNYLTPVSYEALKETGSIEYTADVVYGLQFQILNSKEFNDGGVVEKRKLIDQAKKASPRKIELTCLKNRYGVSSFNRYYDYYPNVDLFVENENDLDIVETKKKVKKY